MALTVSNATASPLVITLFGPFAVLVGGEPIAHLRSRKAQWLLALLVLRHGRAVEREWLAGILWPDVEQTLAFANLRPILSELRKALGTQSERLQSPNRRSLAFDLTGVEVDVLEFDVALANKSLAALERAVVLYRGPLLEGCSEEWVTQERSPREQACLAALKTLAEAASEAGEYGTASDYWRRAVALDPLWEVAWRGLMESLDKGGDRNAALQTYREFVGVLRANDSRAVPGEETTALYQRLRNEARRQASASPPDEEMTTAPVVAGHLPNSLTELVGREDERLEVAEGLRHSRLVTLTGPGGIGKTRLAVAVAHYVVGEYPDGVWLVGLDALPPGNGSGEEERQPVIRQIASVVGITEGSGRPLLTVVTERLRRKQMLLVLDNCEHLTEPCAGVIASLLHGCPGVRILATSRETLQVSGEATWSVPTLTVPDVEQMPSGRITLVRMLTGYDGVRLFVERAEAVRKTFALTGDNARDVARLCSRLAGIPLALELAAARIAVLTPAEILAQFDARPLDALASRLRDTVPRHRTLRATLEWSYGLLPPETQTFLLAMSVFRGGWTLEAAQAVCPDDAAARRLIVLQDASLINVTETADGPRFSMLETVRQFAAEGLERSGRTASVCERHARYYAHLMKEKYSKELLAQYSSASVEREYTNIRLALHWALEVDVGMALELCRNLLPLWAGSGRSEEGHNWLGIMVHRVNQEKHEGENQSAGVRADGEALSLRIPSERSTSRQLMLWDTQYWFYSTAGAWEEAFTVGLQIFEFYRSQGDPVGGRTYLFNASQCRMAWDLNGALEILEQCLPLERVGSSDGRANPIILSRLAEMNRCTGHSERAAQFFTETLDLIKVQKDDDVYGCASGLWYLGWSALVQGDLLTARGYFEAALSYFQHLSAAQMIAQTLSALATVARESGDRELGEVLLFDAIKTAGSASPRTLARIRNEQVESLLAGGDRPGATILIREMLASRRDRARWSRATIYPLLLLMAETQGMESAESRRSAWAARLLGGAGSMAARLGLIVPSQAEQRRTAFLRATLIERLGPERFAIEEIAGAALDDEAALELALTIEQ